MDLPTLIPLKMDMFHSFLYVYNVSQAGYSVTKSEEDRHGFCGADLPMGPPQEKTIENVPSPEDQTSKQKHGSVQGMKTHIRVGRWNGEIFHFRSGSRSSDILAPSVCDRPEWPTSTFATWQPGSRPKALRGVSTWQDLGGTLVSNKPHLPNL